LFETLSFDGGRFFIARKWWRIELLNNIIQFLSRRQRASTASTSSAASSATGR
jgi:hypothetical protein